MPLEDPASSFALVADPNGTFEFDKKTGAIKDLQGKEEMKMMRRTNSKGNKVPLKSRPVKDQPASIRVAYTKRPAATRHRVQKRRRRRRRSAKGKQDKKGEARRASMRD